MIVVVNNPVSGLNRRKPALAASLRAKLPAPHRFEEPATLQAYDDLAADLLDQQERGNQVDVVCVNGGDGTLAHTLSALARTWGPRPLPQIAILRGGTMNTVAHGIGLTGRPQAILRRVLKRHTDGQPQPTTTRHLMRVADGLGVDRYGFLFGNGVISNFLEAYYEGGNPSPLKGAMILIRVLLSGLVGGAFARRLTRLTDVRVSLDGQTWAPDSYIAVAAGTADDMGFGFRPFGDVVAHPGKLQAQGFACSRSALALRIPGIRFGRAWSHPDIIDHLGDCLVLAADQPISYMIEGDFHRGGQQVEISVGPAIRLIHR